MDCFGFVAPSCFLWAFVVFAVVTLFRFGGGEAGGGSGAGLIVGESRNTDGDGIVMVSISNISGKQTFATAGEWGVSPAPGR